MNAPAILFDSYCQNFVNRRGFLQIVSVGSVVRLDNDDRTIVEIVSIDNMKDGDMVYTCKGLESEYRGSPCKLFVPAPSVRSLPLSPYREGGPCLHLANRP